MATDPLTGARRMELTEPWKSMNLPIDGGTVDASTDAGLLVRFPALPADDAGALYAAITESLLVAGWTSDRETSGPPEWRGVFSRDGTSVSLRVEVENGRPLASLTRR